MSCPVILQDTLFLPGPGSRGKNRPCSFNCRFRSSQPMPGPTTTSRSSGWKAMTSFMCSVKDRQIPPWGAAKCPSRLVPPENGITAILQEKKKVSLKLTKVGFFSLPKLVSYLDYFHHFLCVTREDNNVGSTFVVVAIA